ncbi:MAG: HlyD family secretion protein [Sphingomonadaceae bacterium]
MKRPPAIVFILLAVAMILLSWLIVAPHFRPARTLSGYVEGEALYLSAPVAGTVAAVSVRRGQRVDGTHDALFAIKPDQLAAQKDQAIAELAAAMAEAEDARKGQRPAELSVLTAEQSATEASVRDARATLERVTPLAAKGFVSRANLDTARAAYDSALARARAASRRIQAARLGERSDQIRAADARVTRARAALAETGARLDDMAPSAPAPGRIEDVFYQRGEWVAANQPIVALIPDDRMFVRFFAPEAEVSAYQPGARIRFSCDGCAADLGATIVYVSPRPEFTPPVIYSRESRDRMVFMVEARPDRPRTLIPGQPVDVEPLS